MDERGLPKWDETSLDDSLAPAKKGGFAAGKNNLLGTNTR